MNLSTPTKTLGNISSTKSPVFKDFRELSLAIWKDHNLAEAIIQTSDGEEPQIIVRYYNLTYASRYLGKTEAALRLFLWENGLSPDVKSEGTPLFSEDFLDLIDAYGYLFDYSKKWRQSGHHEEADNLIKEAHAAFGLAASAVHSIWQSGEDISKSISPRRLMKKWMMGRVRERHLPPSRWEIS